MLLSRFTFHVKEQNWFAVTLDMCVVVVGIFLGLQVAEWNNALKNSALEKKYIQRILKDLESDEKYTKRVDSSSRIMLEHIKFFELALKDNEELKKNPELFVQTVRRMSWFFPWKINSQSYEELTTTGNLLLLKNATIRKSLNQYYGSIEITKYWQQAMAELSIEYRKNMSGLLTTDMEIAVRRMEETGVDLEQAITIKQNYLQRKELLALIPSMASLHANVQGKQKLLSVRTSQLKNELENYLESID